MRLCDMTLEELIRPEGFDCACGRHHRVGLRFVRIGRGAVAALPEALRAVGVRKPFIVCDQNTKAAAWEKVRTVLDAAGVDYTLYCFPWARVEPDERAMGSLTLAFDPACDGVIAMGSGVINDCCKVLCHAAQKTQITVCTAPSMDGYASDSSSMIVNGVKTTVYNACPAAIIADTDILRTAPDRMLWAGLGDMLAKYIAACEWRMTALINGEYYCEEIAELMRASLRKIVAAAPRLMERDDDTLAAVTEGLILSGVAMAFAKVSRPASGLEHYFSHMWEMFHLDRGLPAELHGIQVGVGTVLCLKIYEKLRTLRPDSVAFQRAAEVFDENVWESEMRRVMGGSADTLIRAEKTEWHNNDPAARAHRFDCIRKNWDALLRIMDEELPDAAQVLALMKQTGMPMLPGEIGENDQDVRDAFLYSRSARKKYLTSTLLWDMGILEDFLPVLE